MEGLIIRYTLPTDAKPVREWFREEEILRWFPVKDEWEVDDSVKRWVGFCRYRASLTAQLHGEVIGLATLYLQPYRKLTHQCEFGIIVSPKHRNKGIGLVLMQALMKLAKEQFHMELLHLQVYEGNPAIRLYERLGFKEFGRQAHWIKDDGEYVGRIFMEKEL